jgi:integrase
VARRPACPRDLAPVRLDRAAEAFIEFIRSRCAADASTPSAKTVIIRALIDRLGGSTEVWTLTSGSFDDTLTWIINGASPTEAAQRRADGRKPRTGRTTKGSIRGASVVLRQFATFCHRQHWLDERVTLQREIFEGRKTDLQTEPTTYVRIPEHSWEMILVMAENVHMRCRMAVALGFYCGRRISEIVALRWEHIDWENQVIHFYNKKAGRPVSVPLHPAIRREIEYWCAWALRVGYGPPQPGWYLVANRVDSRYIHGPNSRARLRLNPTLWRLDMTSPTATGTIWKDIRKLLNQLNLGAKEGTHTFRRSAAAMMSELYGPEAARALLDHKNLATTEAYIGPEIGLRKLNEALMERTGFRSPSSPRQATLPDNVRPLRRVS